MLRLSGELAGVAVFSRADQLLRGGAAALPSLRRRAGSSGRVRRHGWWWAHRRFATAASATSSWLASARPAGDPAGALAAQDPLYRPGQSPAADRSRNSRLRWQRMRVGIACCAGGGCRPFRPSTTDTAMPWATRVPGAPGPLLRPAHFAGPGDLGRFGGEEFPLVLPALLAQAGLMVRAALQVEALRPPPIRSDHCSTLAGLGDGEHLVRPAAVAPTGPYRASGRRPQSRRDRAGGWLGGTGRWGTGAAFHGPLRHQFHPP